MFANFIPLWLQSWWIDLVLISISMIVFKYLHHWLLPVHLQSLVQLLFCSLLAQLIQVAAVWVLLSGLGHYEGWYTYGFVFLLSSIVSLLPISIGGFGTREVTFLTLMPLIGESVTHGVIIAMMFYWIQVSANLVGEIFKQSLSSEGSSVNDLEALKHKA